MATTTAGSAIYYTTDGSTPTTSSLPYLAPFLLTSSATLNAITVRSDYNNSSVASQNIVADVPSGQLAWSDEFTNSGNANAQPNPNTWTYDVGLGSVCCGNNEQETYCAWGSSTGLCNPATPNAYIAPGGGLNIVTMQPSAGVYTSGRLKSQGLFSFQYGRIEAKLLIPESQGMWPAFWLLGNNAATIGWPACGEADVMEHIDGSNPPPYVGGAPYGYDWIAGSVHGGTLSNELGGGADYHASGYSAAAWHTYGMIWTKGQIQYYVDSPLNIYATDNTGSGIFNATTWPFDQGPMFIILNLAVGGSWPGNVDGTTVFPSTFGVEYVRIYAN
jgi:beta-glucanase (GH16 family)